MSAVSQQAKDTEITDCFQLEFAATTGVARGRACRRLNKESCQEGNRVLLSCLMPRPEDSLDPNQGRLITNAQLLVSNLPRTSYRESLETPP